MSLKGLYIKAMYRRGECLIASIVRIWADLFQHHCPFGDSLTEMRVLALKNPASSQEAGDVEKHYETLHQCEQQ